MRNLSDCTFQCNDSPCSPPLSTIRILTLQRCRFTRSQWKKSACNGILPVRGAPWHSRQSDPPLCLTQPTWLAVNSNRSAPARYFTMATCRIPRLTWPVRATDYMSVPIPRMNRTMNAWMSSSILIHGMHCECLCSCFLMPLPGPTEPQLWHTQAW